MSCQILHLYLNAFSFSCCSLVNHLFPLTHLSSSICPFLGVTNSRIINLSPLFSKINSFGNLGFVVAGPVGRSSVDIMIVLSQAGFCGVDPYLSSWVIRPVQSRKGDGVLSSCEVILLHSKDMGIPIDVAKLGVSHGMWGTMKKLHGVFRAFQIGRKQDMAIITTKISFEESVYGDHKEEDVTTTARGSGVDWRRVAICEPMAVVFVRMDKLCLPESREADEANDDDGSSKKTVKRQAKLGNLGFNGMKRKSEDTESSGKGRFKFFQSRKLEQLSHF